MERVTKLLGISLGQLLLGVAFIGSWWATVKPLPEQLQKLNETVSSIVTKVEVHAVLLKQFEALTAELHAMRKEISTLQGVVSAQGNFNKKL
jgi:hypothetical protein